MRAHGFGGSAFLVTRDDTHAVHTGTWLALAQKGQDPEALLEALATRAERTEDAGAGGPAALPAGARGDAAGDRAGHQEGGRVIRLQKDDLLRCVKRLDPRLRGRLQAQGPKLFVAGGYVGGRRAGG